MKLIQKIVISIFVIPIIMGLWLGLSVIHKTSIKPQLKQERFADGCKYIFLDVGSNIGVHVRFLYQPHLYPGVMTNIFDKAFGKDRRAFPSNFSEICAFGFEANPNHAPRLNRLENCFNKRGYRVKFFVPVAVSDKSETSLWYWREFSDNAVAWGGRIVDDEEKNKLNLKKGILSDIPSIDLSKFMREQIQNRIYDKTRGEGFVYAKIDIEGSEFSVLPSLEKNGMLCKKTGIDLITTEFHPNLFTPRNDYPTYKSFQEHFQRKTNEHCERTEITLLDSEEYLLDNQNTLEASCLYD